MLGAYVLSYHITASLRKSIAIISKTLATSDRWQTITLGVKPQSPINSGEKGFP